MRSSGNITKGVIKFSDMELRYANIADGIELPLFNMVNLSIVCPISSRCTFTLNDTGLTERSPGTDKSGFYATEVMSARHTPLRWHIKPRLSDWVN